MKKHSINMWRIFVNLLCAVLLILVSLTEQTLAAETAKTVRVGYYHEINFEEGKDAQSLKKGYAYEYYQTLARYTGWKYDYVYGSYDDLYAKLLKGEIDFLAGLGYVEARKQVLSYPELPMGYEYYDLVKHLGNNSLSNDINSLNGKRLGVLEGAMVPYLQKYLADNQLTATISTYKNMQERDAALRSDRVDAIIAEDTMGDLDGVEVFKRLGNVGYYIAVNKARPDLLTELNAAQKQLQEEHPVYLASLRDTYYHRTAFKASLSDAEKEWILQHKVLRVGYVDSFMPFSSTDKQGKVTGVVKDVTTKLLQELRIEKQLKPEYKSFSDTNAAVAALHKREIDVIFPIDTDQWMAEQSGVLPSDTVVSTPLNIVYRGNSAPQRVNRVAANNRTIYTRVLSRVFYPQAEIVLCDNINACFRAVAAGEADVLFLYGVRDSNVDQNSPEYSSLHSLLVGSRGCGYGVNVGDVALLNLLNRGLSLIDRNYSQSLLQTYSVVPEDLSLAAFVNKHFLVTVLLIGAFVLLVVCMAYIVYRNAQKTKAMNAQLLERKTKLEEVTGEQEAQIEEIKALNDKLEEASAEQEAQLEEIGALNEQLESNQGELEASIAEQETQIEKISALNEQLESNQKKLELAKEEAEAANSAKTSFLFNMSHDIRTPMNAIMGFRDLLEKHQEDPQKRKDYLGKIQDASTVLLSIINNVLEMARIEKGTLEIDETAWSTEQFNDTLYSVFHVLMQEKGLKFTRQIEVQHHYVYCDPTKLREIFLNILSNAYKYTNVGGSVNMHLEEIPSPRAGYVLYRTTISDTGIGMSEEFLPHIFEEFSRERNTTEAKVEGTGLGMPIVKRLVEMLDGTIEIKSQKGVGSTFIVTLPHRIAAKTNLVQHAGVEIDPKLFKDKRILLAEDNDLNAEIAMEILSEAGFIVDRAEDGAVCVDMLKEAEVGHYDLILMDIQMPNMNGYEATRAIRQLEEHSKANIKILAMTANAFEEDKREALRAGMNGHLAKPINVNELMKTLAGMLG